MGKWLYCWELGSGMGHLRRMATISKGLSERGENVTWCVRAAYLDAARALWSPVIGAPQVPLAAPPLWPASFAELLQSEGWNHAASLAAWTRSWSGVFEAHPDFGLLADFAPNALLAAVLARRPIQVVGTGFYCPPDHQPFPLIRHDDSVYAERPAIIEQLILDQCNTMLSSAGHARLPRLAALFHGQEVIHHFCTETVMDHYSGRRGIQYCGIPGARHGTAPTWSTSDGARIFAYLKAAPGLDRLLAALSNLDADVLVHGDTSVGKSVGASGFPNLRFLEHAVDERALDGHCDLAINHAGHDGSAKLIRAGVPLLQLPLNIEQSLVARRVAETGAGRWILPDAWPGLRAHVRDALDAGASMRAAGREASRSWVPFESAAVAVVNAILDRA